MLKICAICKKSALTGNYVVRKGLAKKKGGTGKKTSRTTKRKFLPNLQKMRILVNGHPRKIYICAKCVKKGEIIKA